MSAFAAEVAIVLMLLGAVGGSFTATAVLRGLRQRQVISGRSACDACGTTLTYTESLPVLSYLARRGACRTCRNPIDPVHLVGETMGGLIGLCVGVGVLSPSADLLASVALAARGFSLLALSLVDSRTQRIPDGLLAVVLLSSLLLLVHLHLPDLATHLAWAGAVFVVLILLRSMFVVLHGDPGLGLGEVKLLSALAVWLGPLTPCALVLACALALLSRVLTGRLTGRAPFGPWIALGAWIVGLAAELHPWPV